MPCVSAARPSRRAPAVLAGAVVACAAASAAGQTVNYRSIGTNAATLYDTGTASITAGTSTVTFGGGAALPASIGPGDRLVIGGAAAIARLQAVTGSATASPVTMPSINGGTDQTYVLFVATRNNADVTNVTGGGLTWTQRVEQCGGSDGTGARVYTAQGSPGAAFEVQITYGPDDSLAAVLARYSGVTSIEDPTGENVNGEGGACSGGTDNANAQLTLSSTLNGSVHALAVASGRRNVVGADSTYSQIGTTSAGTGGTTTKIYAYDKTFDPAATEQFTATINQAVDWTTGGVVLAPDGTIGATFYVLSRDSATQVTVQETASVSHTDGTYTINRAFSTLQGWEDARQGELVAEDRCEVGVCRDDGAFTGGLVISGSTTNPTHYLTLTAVDGERHMGLAGSGVVLDAGGGLGVVPVDIANDYSRIEWLEINDVQDSQGGMNITGASVTADGLLLHDITGAAVATSGTGTTLRNTCIYDITVAEGIAVTAGTATIENCTVYGGTMQGVRSYAGSSVTIRNTISVGNMVSDFTLMGTVTLFGNNMYRTTTGFDPASHEGGNVLPPGDLDDLFVSIAYPYDLHLEILGHDAINNGLDLSATFTHDIDGAVRARWWEIGADDLPPTRRVLAWQEVEP